MAEHVVTFGGGPFAGRDRVRVMVNTLGRGRDQREADALFAWLQAARGRYAIGAVRQHVCRHDEGVPDCSGVVTEG